MLETASTARSKVFAEWLGLGWTGYSLFNLSGDTLTAGVSGPRDYLFTGQSQGQVNTFPVAERGLAIALRRNPGHLDFFRWQV